MTSRERKTMGLLCDLFNDLKELKQICYRHSYIYSTYIEKNEARKKMAKKLLWKIKRKKANEYTYLRIFGLKDILHGKFIRFYFGMNGEEEEEKRERILLWLLFML